MNAIDQLSFVTMPKEQALAEFEKYKAAVKRSHDAADRMMVKAYKTLSEGQGVLNLRQALSKGGVDPQTWLPKLAAMRADQPLVHFKRLSSHNGFYSHSSRNYLSRSVKTAQTARLQFVLSDHSLPLLPEGKRQPDRFWWAHSAPVPPIPPQFRPADALSKYVILWEVATWSPVQPPDDPILLKPLGGDLYAVVAQWDLTPIEQMVLASIMAGN
jgi:hypothetical protein